MCRLKNKHDVGDFSYTLDSEEMLHSGTEESEGVQLTQPDSSSSGEFPLAHNEDGQAQGSKKKKEKHL